MVISFLMVVLSDSYLQAYNMIRGITGVGEGKGPYITIHDGFNGLSVWSSFLTGGDRIGLGKSPSFTALQRNGD